MVPTARQTVIVAQPQPVQELPMVERRAVRARQRVECEEETSGQSVHEYFYVPDSPPPSDEDEFADDEPPPPVCHGPGNPPTDYLNPEPSSDEIEEEGAEFSTVPFYQNTQIRNVGATGSSHSTTADNTETGASEMILDSNAETLDDTACVENSDSDTTESGYVRYSPQLYENTMP
ncbi:hypothetical protein BaRGS_00033045 [Batillaria attramentaria]|uniref:Uncharacterized protein n=1 Tax=Batillaria attramentaria TaxID=370345 RepID=A0ABD0JLX7_9CAEN